MFDDSICLPANFHLALDEDAQSQVKHTYIHSAKILEKDKYGMYVTLQLDYYRLW